ASNIPDRRRLRPFLRRRGGPPMPSKQIKDEKMYKELRKDGASKEKAARIANASAKRGRAAVGRKGGRAGDHDDCSKEDLETRARESGIAGRSKMNKSQLIDSLRNH